MINLFELKRPFQPREHDFNYSNWCYIAEYAISERLDEVCGMDGWRITTVETTQHTPTHWSCTVNLSIKVGENRWVVRSGVGENVTPINKPYKDGPDPLEDYRYMQGVGENAKKGAFTDAFRRAARLWGIGRYLLELPRTDKGKPTIVNHQQLTEWLKPRFKAFVEERDKMNNPTDAPKQEQPSQTTPIEPTTPKQTEQPSSPSGKVADDFWTRLYTDEQLLKVYKNSNHMANALNKEYAGGADQAGLDGFDVVKQFLLNRKQDAKPAPMDE